MTHHAYTKIAAGLNDALELARQPVTAICRDCARHRVAVGVAGGVGVMNSIKFMNGALLVGFLSVGVYAGLMMLVIKLHAYGVIS